MTRPATTTAAEILGNIDWTLLKTQKRWLIAQPECDEATGLLNLIDAIQDHAVDVLGVPEHEVFDLEGDGED